MSTLPDYIQGAFKEALARVPQRVLWKYEGEMENVPKNVMIKKWFPQRDILSKIFWLITIPVRDSSVLYTYATLPRVRENRIV